MTDLSVMLKWYAPETDAVILHCDECGCEMVSSDGRQRKILCSDCKVIRNNERAYITKRERGAVRFDFDDPEVSLVYAIINRAMEDKAHEWHAPPMSLFEDTDMLLTECNPADFIADGGVELWLAALGIGIRPSMSKAIRNLEA